jgi:hypothetical protein
VTTQQPQSLQEVSQRLAEVNRDLAASEERIEELERPLRTERGRYHRLDNEKERLLQALEVAKRAYFIAEAAAGCGYATTEPPVVIVRDREENLGKFGLPTVWELVAVAPDGTGLYKHTPPKVPNYRGKLRNLHTSRGHAIRAEAVPNAVRAVVEADREAGEAISRVLHEDGYSRERTARIDAMRKQRKQLREEGYEALGLDRYAEVRFEGDLTMWQARGKDQYGGHDGPYKPLKPPNGGRWRWLKVEEQRDLPATTEVNG